MTNKVYLRSVCEKYFKVLATSTPVGNGDTLFKSR